MSPFIECCTTNVSQRLYEHLDNSNDATLQHQYCLQRCWLCERKSFVVADGDVVIEEGEDSLIDTLQTELSLDLEGRR